MAFTGLNGNMGINRLGDPFIVFKRKFRWTFAVQPNCPGIGSIDPWFVKTAARPNFSVDETELNFLNEKMWIPGKVTYETISVTYIDVAPKEPSSANLFKWLGAVYQFWSPSRQMGSSLADYGAVAQLILYDPCGVPIEEWDFQDIWPQAINFGELDMSSSDTVDIELTLRYSRFTYRPLCDNFTFASCCTGCA